MKVIPALIQAAGFKKVHPADRRQNQARALAALLHKWTFPITGTQVGPAPT